jgi:GTP-binding protein Era
VKKFTSLFGEEIPLSNGSDSLTSLKKKESLIKIQADIIVHRESQKAILLGEGGKNDKTTRNKSKNGY